ncbi:sterol desaturase family protein [Parapedobacter koreensis]|uniref:Fatty acid hydroxylase superfamily protein n=1 Tax=Parapedobacter koreensis TaxID=332977 RepID=A0A1H7F6G6_9SPHI|nr:sterol desaturase family protein [Parapedobacter koreensis]SEK21636.1 Fatty acid hydroxylase superfamily protein [Parapedobacter koreensis]
MAKRNFVSNSSESTRMFKSDFLESLTKVHFSVPLFIYLPVVGYFSWKALGPEDMPILNFIGYFLLGLSVWTISEYLLHRFVFHFEPKGKFMERIHFIFHGVHHDYPKDRLRLVMPPSASIPMAIVIYFIFRLFFSVYVMNAFFPGFMLGYLFYDMTHYAIHHANFRGGIWKKIKQHHMLHHYSDPEKGFGVSSAFWDGIFGTGFKQKGAADE